MKRLAIIIASISVLVVCLAGFLIFHQHSAFRLDPEYYGAAEIAEITIDQLRALIDGEKSFAVFAHQPGCQTSAELAQIVQDFSDQNSLKVYQTNFSDLKSSGLVPGLRFYPTFVIFHAGEVADFLMADSDEDVAAFTSLEGFTEWFSGYAQLK